MIHESVNAQTLINAQTLQCPLGLTGDGVTCQGKCFSASVLYNRIVFAAVSVASFVALVVLSNPAILGAVSIAAGEFCRHRRFNRLARLENRVVTTK